MATLDDIIEELMDLIEDKLENVTAMNFENDRCRVIITEGTYSFQRKEE